MEAAVADGTAPSVDADGGNCGGAATGDGAAPVVSDNGRGRVPAADGGSRGGQR